MKNRISFRKDLRRKLILFGLVPLFIFGAVSLWPIYQNEWVRVENEHKQLLNVIKQIVKIFYSQTDMDFKNIDTDIEKGNIADLRQVLDQYREIDSLLVVDANGTKVQKVLERAPSVTPVSLDRELADEIQRMLKMKKNRRQFLYYSQLFKKVFATYLLKHGEKIYVINIDIQPYLDGIKSLIQRSDIRSVYIYLPSGKYLYNSAGMEPIIRGETVFDQSDYVAAIKGKKPYEVTEYPTHYKEGDSFWDGLFDLDSFLSYAPIDEPPLTVAVKDSEDTIDYYLGGLLLVWVGLMIFTIIVVLLVSKVMLNYIVNPVEKTICNINNLTKGLPPVEKGISADRTYPIFADLVKSFETMRRRVKDREEKLNEQIVINTEIQKKLAQNEKKAALGDITSNIAHQWRQPLSTISTLATGMLMEKEMGLLTDESIKEFCKQINENAQYLSNTIDDFRKFALSDREEDLFDVRTSIENLMKLMENRLKDYHVHTEIHIEKDLKVYGYSNHFLQMLINLVNNSIDALLANRDDDRYLKISVGEDARGSVIVKVRDNGGGIDPKIINRIFEPYFTTKHKSQGTGLGLHMTQRLAEESLKGSIEVENVTFRYRGKSFQGAEFTVTLPKAENGKEKEA
jgi:signal transduction histidine kinase